MLRTQVMIMDTVGVEITSLFSVSRLREGRWCSTRLLLDASETP